MGSRVTDPQLNGRTENRPLSTLTKVFVVLLSVFSVAFTVMTVSVVAQVTNWRETALKYEEHARVADTNLRNMIAASAADLAAARDQVQLHVARTGDLETKLSEQTNARAQLRADLAKAQADDCGYRGWVALTRHSARSVSDRRARRDTNHSRGQLLLDGSPCCHI